MPPRQRFTPRSSVTIHFDPVTWEKLTRLSGKRGHSHEKIVYLATLNELAQADEAADVSVIEEPEPYDWKKVKAFPPLD